MSQSSKGALSLIWSKQWTQEQGRHRSPTRKEGNSFHFCNCPLHQFLILHTDWNGFIYAIFPFALKISFICDYIFLPSPSISILFFRRKHRVTRQN